MSPAEVLGLDAAAAADPAAVRRAYARLLKQHRPDRDPEGFRRIRDAYEALCGGDPRPAADPVPQAPDPPARQAAAPPVVDAPAPAASRSAVRAQVQPLLLLQRGDWDGLARLADERSDPLAARAPRIDLDLARCFALVDPELAFALAQRAFEADRNAVDPWMEALLEAGMSLSTFPIADRRSAAAAALDALPAGDDPETARRLRVMACQVPHAGLRTTLTAAAVRIDSAGYRRQETELAQRREQIERQQFRRQLYSGLALMAIAVAVIAFLLHRRSAPAPETAGPPPVAAPAPPAAAAPAAGAQPGVPTVDSVAERIAERARAALEDGNVTLAVLAFKPPSRQSDAADIIQEEALRRVLGDASIGVDRRILFARRLLPTLRPGLQQVVAEVMPEALDRQPAAEAR